jgi:opacity protein-like surface antigen
MKLMAACIVVAVLLPGLAAWSQNYPKVEISINYSHVHFAAIDFRTKHSEFYRAYNLNGGGGSVVFDFGRLFGLKAEFQGYASQTREIFLPPGNPYIPQGAVANVPGNLFTYLFGPQIGKRFSIFRPYAHALVGGAHSDVYTHAWSLLNLTQFAPFASSASSNAFAVDAGAGLDVAVGQHLAIRPLEVSYLYTDFKNPLTNNQHSFRYLGGIVYNIGGKPRSH